MNFQEYIRFIMPFKEICKGFPTQDETFAIHFDDCNKKIPSFELFKRCWHKHRESSHFFPSNVELTKLSLPDFPMVDANNILKCESEVGIEINYILREKYGVSLPDQRSEEFTKALSTTTAKWLDSIRYYLPKLVEDYKELKIDYRLIFTKEVIQELGFDMKLLGE